MWLNIIITTLVTVSIFLNKNKDTVNIYVWKQQFII